MIARCSWIRARRRAELRVGRDAEFAHESRAAQTYRAGGRRPPCVRRPPRPPAQTRRDSRGIWRPCERSRCAVLAKCCGAEPDGAGAGRRPAWRQAIAYRGRGGAAVHPLRRIARAGATGREQSTHELPVPLMVDHEIVNLPSASALAALRRETIARRPAPRTVALLADPVFELDDPRVSLEVRKAAPREHVARRRQTWAGL